MTLKNGFVNILDMAYIAYFSELTYRSTVTSLDRCQRNVLKEHATGYSCPQLPRDIRQKYRNIEPTSPLLGAIPGQTEPCFKPTYL